MFTGSNFKDEVVHPNQYMHYVRAAAVLKVNLKKKKKKKSSSSTIVFACWNFIGLAGKW